MKSQEEAQGKDEHKEMEINGNRNKKAKTKLGIYAQVGDGKNVTSGFILPSEMERGKGFDY